MMFYIWRAMSSVNEKSSKSGLTPVMKTSPPPKLDLEAVRQVSVLTIDTFGGW
jgi:hypothetical protein